MPPFKERVSLFLDDKLVNITSVDEGGLWIVGNPNNNGVDYYLYGPYFFGSNHILFFGEHTAKVVIVTGSGEKLEYEWSFKIK